MKVSAVAKPGPLEKLNAAGSTEMNFGQNLINETQSGTLRIGDAVELS